MNFLVQQLEHQDLTPDTYLDGESLHVSRLWAVETLHTSKTVILPSEGVVCSCT